MQVLVCEYSFLEECKAKVKCILMIVYHMTDVYVEAPLICRPVCLNASFVTVENVKLHSDHNTFQFNPR